MDPVFLKGLAAFLIMVVVFIGSVWLLTSMILGVRMGYFVTASCFFGVMILISLIWLVTALGPKGAEGFVGKLGEDTAWHAIATGDDLSTVESEFGSFDVANYPQGDWEAPSPKGLLADLRPGKGENTQKELETVKPVMDSLVISAVSPVPGIREDVAELVQSDVQLVSGQFQITDVRMREATVDGKESIVAVGRAVPSDMLNAGKLDGAEEGKVSKFLAEPGEVVSVGDPTMAIKTDSRTIELKADKKGRLISFGFRIGDKIKPDVNFAVIDITGQPQAPDPVEVAAVRVRGSVRTPSVIYLVVSLLLFALHMAGLRNTERAAKRIPAAADGGTL